MAFRPGRIFAVVAVSALCVSGWFVSRFDISAAFASGLNAYRLHDLGSLEGQIAMISESADSDADSLKILRAAAALLRERPLDALSLLGEVKHSDEMDTAALQIRGEALYQLERYGEAEECLSRFVVARPDNLRAHRLLAVIYYDIGAMKQTIRHLKEVMRLAPRDYRPHRMIGQIYFDFEKYVEATRAFRMVVSLPGEPLSKAESRQLLAKAESKLGNYEAALTALRPILQMPSTFGIQAKCLWNLGKLDEARALLSKAIAIPSPDVETVLTFARISLEENDPDSALEILHKALVREPGCVDCRHQLAMAYRVKGDLERCHQELEANEKVKQLKTQLTALSDAAIDQPLNWKLRLEMSDVCDQLGMKKMSETWRRAAQVIQPPNPLQKTSKD